MAMMFLVSISNGGSPPIKEEVAKFRYVRDALKYASWISEQYSGSIIIVTGRSIVYCRYQKGKELVA